MHHYEPYNCEMAGRHLRARWEAERQQQAKETAREELLREKAHELMRLGVCLIPSEHLLDNEVMVSREVFEAAKRSMTSE